jgi:toxin-antitoxin system PIN domain toxin
LTVLLDVNVLIALIDPAHVSHDDAHAWFGRQASGGWATCPLTENGVIRIVGNPRYPNNPGPPASVAAVVTRLRALPGHVFWTDDISLLAEAHIDFAKILTSAQVTDTYLLGLSTGPGRGARRPARDISTADCRLARSGAAKPRGSSCRNGERGRPALARLSRNRGAAHLTGTDRP